MSLNVSNCDMMRKKAVVVSLAAVFLLAHAPALGAGTAGFAFITEPQSIRAGELSGGLTIQSQDAAGDPVKTDETVYLNFSSTSATGEFLSVAGEAVRTVMNKGTANRTFYYRDPSPGLYTLTVKATARGVPGQSWIASQGITVRGIGTSSAVSDVSSSVSSSAAATPASESSSASQNKSVRASGPIPSIEAYAGENRSAPAGSEIEFSGSAVGLLGRPIENARFLWNFGDGELGEGRIVRHRFRSPGAYMTGLFVSSGDYAASDYVTVAVVPGAIDLSFAAGKDGFVRVRNDASAAMEIGGWVLEDGSGSAFIFPPRTVIGARADAAFANRVTGIAPKKEAFLRYPDRTIAATAHDPMASSGFTPSAPVSGAADSARAPAEAKPAPPRAPPSFSFGQDADIGGREQTAGTSSPATGGLGASGVRAPGGFLPGNPASALFLAAAVMSLFSAGGFLFLRRMVG